MSEVVKQRVSRARIIVGVVVAIIAILVVVLATRPAADITAASPLVGRQAPALTGTALDGRNVDLASMRGRWVVVNFFATWCLPCRQEHPEMVKFTQKYTGANDPAVVAVGFDQNDIANARSFFAENGGNWPVVPDDKGRIAIGFGVRGLPESFIIDPEGKIAERITGAVTEQQLMQSTRVA